MSISTSCSLCSRESFILPVALECGHVFDLMCIRRFFHQCSFSCPIDDLPTDLAKITYHCNSVGPDRLTIKLFFRGSTVLFDIDKKTSLREIKPLLAAPCMGELFGRILLRREVLLSSGINAILSCLFSIDALTKGNASHPISSIWKSCVIFQIQYGHPSIHLCIGETFSDRDGTTDSPFMITVVPLRSDLCISCSAGGTTPEHCYAEGHLDDVS